MSDVALYGLIGFPLEHSFSPEYFKKKFAAEGISAEYRAFPLGKIQQYKQLLEEFPTLKGLNITIPYKEEVIQYIDEVDADAAITKAVNCIRFADGKSIGYNTDVIGFAQSLKPLLQPHMSKALVLGSGGASKAVRFVLDKLGIEFTVVSRIENEAFVAYKDVTDKVIEEHPLIINTTPLGMHPDVASYPEIPYYALTDKHLLYDVVYNPAETKFMQFGKEHGAQVKNGQEMLEMQAEASWLIWNS